MNINSTHLFYVLSLAALSSCVSVAATNIFLTLGILLFFILLYKKDIDMGILFSQLGSKFMLCFFGILVLCSLFGVNTSLSLRETWQVYIYRMLPFFLAGGLYKKINRRQFEILFLCLFSSCTVSSIVAIYQFLNGNLRPSGLASHYMHLGGYYVIILPIFLAFLLDDISLDWFKYKQNLIIPFTVCIAGFIANNTRGAWITVSIVSIIALFVFGIRKPKKLLCGLIAIALCIGFVVNNQYLFQRVKSITSTTNHSNVERTLIWGSAFRMISDYPIMGVGPGGFTGLYQKKYISPKAKEPDVRHCHNLFLQIFSENGILGIVSFLILYIYFIYYGIKEYLKNKNYISILISLIVLSVMLQGLTEFNASVFKDMWLMIGMCYWPLIGKQFF